MAVKCFMSGVEGQQHFDACLNAGVTHVLTSYLQFYDKGDLDVVKRRKKQHPDIHYFVDSGAHTFITDYPKFKHWTRNDFEDYAKGYHDWLLANKDYIFAGVELDLDYPLNMIFGGSQNSTVGPSIVQGWQNKYFRPLQDKGVPIVFCWHTERKMEGWEQMCSDFPYVGLPGGLSHEADFNKYISIARRYMTRIHGFAATKQTDFRDWPWYCMTEEHEILTLRGWKKRDEVTLRDLVYSRNPETGKGESMPIHDIPTFEADRIPIIELKNRNFYAQVTPDHKWPSMRQGQRIAGKREETYCLRKTLELDSSDRLIRSSPADMPKTPIYSDSFVELIAWIWTEGTYSYRGNSLRITFSQSSVVNKDKVSRIKSALRAEGGQYCSWHSDRDGCDYFQLKGELRKSVAAVLPDKELQREFILMLTEKQLNLFIEVSVMADGSSTPRIKKGSKTWHLSQKAGGKSIQVFELACILAGIPVTSYTVKNRKGYSMDCVSASNTTYVYPRELERNQTYIKGKIWCISTPYHTFYTRCKGKHYWTGNSIDSISWKGGEMYGTILHWDEHRQIFSYDQDKSQRYRYRKHFEKAGLDADAIIQQTNYKEVTKYALWSMRQMEKFYEDKYKAREFYYEFRLPPPSAVANVMSEADIRLMWAKYRPEDRFPNHAGTKDPKTLRQYLSAISCIQNKEHSLLPKYPKGEDLLKAAFPLLMTPSIAAPEVFQKEMAAFLSPPNPPALERSDAMHFLPNSNAPKARTFEALDLSSFEEPPQFRSINDFL